MADIAEFDHYMTYLCEGLGNSTRHQSLLEYCSGLMLPIQRKSVEPLAAHADPLHVAAKHQALHHFVANARWSDRVLLERIREYVEPHLKLARDAYWIVDDTAHPKCGRHSVGVARQYCGRLGKQDNCQVAVSLSLATVEGSVPVDYQLYLPEAWARDVKRRRKAKIPETVQFATKSQIALQQIQAAKQRGLAPGIVLADAGYGRDTAFREALDELGLTYVVGVMSSTTAWAPGTGPLPRASSRGRGRPHTRLRRAPGHEPVSMKELAFALRRSTWQKVAWREGTNKSLSSRFARVRYVSRIAITCEPVCVTSSGCSSNGHSKRPNPRNIGCRICLSIWTSAIWSIRRRCAGASKRITMSLSRSSACRTTRVAAGSAFIITQPCALLPMAFYSHSDCRMLPKKTPIDQKRLPYPKITNLAAAGRAQRHVPDSIPTLRYLVSIQLARRLRRCPCCGSVAVRA